MCRLSFYASTVGEIACLMQGRLARFTSLADEGFTDTQSADRYAILEYSVGLLDTNKHRPLNPNELFWVDVPCSLSRGIEVLRIHIDRIKADMTSGIMSTMPTSDYVTLLRNKAHRDRLVEEMTSLMNIAKSNKANLESQFNEVTSSPPSPSSVVSNHGDNALTSLSPPPLILTSEEKEYKDNNSDNSE